MVREKCDLKEGELGPRRWIDHHLKPVGVSTYVAQEKRKHCGFESSSDYKIITEDSERSKLDWVASIPVRVGHEEKSSSGPARRDEDLFSY